MKTYVKYLPDSTPLTIRNGRKRVYLTAGQLTRRGDGESTVQEDGRTVHVSTDAFARLRNFRD